MAELSGRQASCLNDLFGSISQKLCMLWGMIIVCQIKVSDFSIVCVSNTVHRINIVCKKNIQQVPTSGKILEKIPCRAKSWNLNIVLKYREQI